MKLRIGIKQYFPFVFSILAGVYFHWLSWRDTIEVRGADNILFIFNLGLEYSWNGVVFSLLAVLPAAVTYIREYKSGYLHIILTKQTLNAYIKKTAIRNALMGGGALLIPAACYSAYLLCTLDLSTPFTEGGVLRFYRDMGIEHPLGYLIGMNMLIFLCGVAFATLGLGISAWVKKSFLTIALPFASVIGVAMLVQGTPWEGMDLILLYTPNGHDGASLASVLFMDAALTAAGAILFIKGVKKNEEEM